MNVLHLLRSEPDKDTLKLIARLSKGRRCRTVRLYQEDVDYDKLLERVFAANQVISWW